MQARAIALLARKLRTQHQRLKSWPKAAAQLHVFDVEGNPSPGLAYAIAVHGYMPGDAVMSRLIFNGAIPAPPPVPLHLDRQMRKAIIRALQHDQPLPRMDARTHRAFARELHRANLLRRRKVQL